MANTFERVFGETAGGHVHLFEVAKRWRDVELVVFGPAEAREAFARHLPLAKFVTMPSFDFGTGSSHIRNLSRVTLGMLRFSELRACDALLSTSHFLPDVWPAFFARGPRTVVCVHHLIEKSSEPVGGCVAQEITLGFQSIALTIVRTFGRVVVANHPERLRSVGFQAPRFRVVRMLHGVDHLALHAVETPLKAFDALFLGRLAPTKNAEDALAAWVKVLDVFPDARLIIAGTGDRQYVEALQRLALDVGLGDTVRFEGRVSNEQRQALYAAARVFVFPSKEEGWGIALAEAMAYGVPCVTYDLPAFRRDFIGGRIVVPVGSVDDFAAAIIRLLHDADLHARLAEEAIDVARSFSWDEAARVEIEALASVATH